MAFWSRLQGVIGVIGLAMHVWYLNYLLTDFPTRNDFPTLPAIFAAIGLVTFAIGFFLGERGIVWIAGCTLFLIALAFSASILLLASGEADERFGERFYGFVFLLYSWAWIPAICTFVTTAYLGLFAWLGIERLSAARR